MPAHVHTHVGTQPGPLDHHSVITITTLPLLRACVRVPVSSQVLDKDGDGVVTLADLEGRWVGHMGGHMGCRTGAA